MNYQRIAVIYNPKGGSANQGVLNALCAQLDSKFPGAKLLRIATQRDEQATIDSIRAVLADIDLAVSVGGDGTVRVLATAMRGSDVPMAVFPGGTGNLFARTFYGLPTPASFATMLANGVAQPIDLLEAEYTPTGSTELQRRLVLVAIGFGKLSDAIVEADPGWKRRIGSVAYAIGMLGKSFSTSVSRVTVESRQRTEFADEAVSAGFVLNVAPPHLINISRGCNASDGKLDLVLLKASNVWHLSNAAFWLGLGKPERSRHYSRRRQSAVTITCSGGMHLNLDGDSGGHTDHVKVSVASGAVNMVLA